MDLPGKLRSTRKRKVRFISTISVDSVIMSFEKLDRNNKIPKVIQSEYIQMAKSNNLRLTMKPESVANLNETLYHNKTEKSS